MHLSPDSALPPPPKDLPPPGPLPPVAELRARAVGLRPDVAALEQRLAAEQAAVALALKEYKPDFEAMAAYDAFWQPRERDLRPMVGVRMNLPVRFRWRDAAVAEAQARVAQRAAELARLVDQVNLQVQEAYEQAAESERVLRLYRDTTLPTARENVKLAQAEYAVGRVPFLNLIEAQRNLVELRDRYYEVMAEALRRRAALERAIGAPLPLGAPTSAPPATPAKGAEPPKPAPAAPPGRGGSAAPSPGSTEPGPSGT
jgi:cobalt-zinc-cadmium efflux system outer membrane protein